MEHNISAAQLGDLHVLNEQNETISLSALWQEKTAVLVFVRHFG